MLGFRFPWNLRLLLWIKSIPLNTNKWAKVVLSVKIWDFWEPKRTHVDDVVSEGELEHPIQLYLRIP